MQLSNGGRAGSVAPAVNPSLANQPRGAISGIATTAVPPHMRGAMSSAASLQAPHRFLPDFGEPTLSTFATESRPSAPSSTAVGSSVKATPQRPEFNAYDGAGGVRRVAKTRTETSDAGANRPKTKISNSGWAKPEVGDVLMGRGKVAVLILSPEFAQDPNHGA
jgi:hypothetical protein